MITNQMMEKFLEDSFSKAELPKSGLAIYFRVSGWLAIDVLLYYIHASKTKKDVPLDKEVLDKLILLLEGFAKSSEHKYQKVYFLDLIDQLEYYFEGGYIEIDYSFEFNFNDNESSIKRLKKLVKLIFNGNTNGCQLYKCGDYYHLGMTQDVYNQYKRVKIFDLIPSLLIE